MLYRPLLFWKAGLNKLYFNGWLRHLSMAVQLLPAVKHLHLDYSDDKMREPVHYFMMLPGAGKFYDLASKFPLDGISI
ncbi:MAG: hypothetical protein IGNPGNKH_00382 [Sodalis sp. Ffu]|nr:MAG: hypothetical protein IGNPGNKH_00382 [Sodalis sp. Ffu]